MITVIVIAAPHNIYFIALNATVVLYPSSFVIDRLEVLKPIHVMHWKPMLPIEMLVMPAQAGIQCLSHWIPAKNMPG